MSLDNPFSFVLSLDEVVSHPTKLVSKVSSHDPFKGTVWVVVFGDFTIFFCVYCVAIETRKQNHQDDKGS